MINRFLVIFLLLGVFACSSSSQDKAQQKPNIVIIYVDDLGYADVGCYGAKGVATPNIDRLAKEGLRFTDGHSSAATCTPSRFSLLTGKHAFRNKAAILPGDAPLVIRPGTPTIAGMLQKAGYKTGVIGKWHLGLGNGTVNWNKQIKPGPQEIGFDYSFLIPATGDRVPTVYVENQRVVGLDPNDPIQVSYAEKVGDEPTGLSHPQLLKMKADTQHSQTIINGVSRIGYMAGGKAARWQDEDFPDILTQKAKAFITQNKEQPFFLYFAFQDIHVPRVPHPRFVGKSQMGPRGDAIVQMDWCTGEIVKTLEELGLAQNTLIIFTSDNGPVLDDGYADQAEILVGAHNPSGSFKGGKYSAYEAGTRVPTITYWPGVIKPGVSNALVNQIDLYASLAQLVGQKLEKDAAPDSQEMLDTWLGKTNKGRTEMVEEAFVLALRSGDWKYIAPGTQAPDWLKNKKIATGLGEEPQLYNLAQDKAENHNLAQQHPEKVKELAKRLEAIVADPNASMHK
ncbi:arylsulfatase [Adhaeribacter aerolatus]|uniref:Arylsulfatase n=1 Tax=Adhaeribacter aerolatus TaxID=670289 RepID=A0A512B671_9BACT|nr:arylsulfatase [Adhaeribacter aerolatus]GEO07455.1 arylsulfatase [Adhaeribacter aerolatus]